MKYVLAASTLLFSLNTFAQDTVNPYFNCQYALVPGPVLNEAGDFPSTGNAMMPTPTIQEKNLEDGKTQKIYTYQYPAFGGGKPHKATYTITKDKQGRVLSVASGPDQLDHDAIQNYIDNMVKISVHRPVSMSSYDPIMQVDGKMIPMSRLTKSEAKALGVDLDELKKLKSNERKDKKTVSKIHENYKKLLNKSNLMIPNGEQVEFNWENGSCAIQTVSSRLYDTKTKKNITTFTLDKSRCNHMVSVFRKHQKDATACADVQRKISQEMQQGGYVGGVNGGAVGGIAGGIAGGAVGGYYPGGMGGGYPGGSMGGFAYGGFGYNTLEGSESLPPYISMELSKCYMTFGEPKEGSWSESNGSQSGPGSGMGQLGMPMGNGNGIGW